MNNKLIMLLMVFFAHTLTSCKKDNLPDDSLINTQWYQIEGPSCCDTIAFSSNGIFTSTKNSLNQYTLIAPDSVRFGIGNTGSTVDCKYSFINHDTLELFCYQHDLVGSCYDLIFKKKQP